MWRGPGAGGSAAAWRGKPLSVCCSVSVSRRMLPAMITGSPSRSSRLAGTPDHAPQRQAVRERVRSVQDKRASCRPRLPSPPAAAPPRPRLVSSAPSVKTISGRVSVRVAFPTDLIAFSSGSRRSLAATRTATRTGRLAGGKEVNLVVDAELGRRRETPAGRACPA